MKKTDSMADINPIALMIAFMAQSAEKLDAIEEKLEKKVAYLKVDDAVASFRKHIDEEHKKPRNFYPIIDQFKSRFAGKNVALLTANETDDFLTARWGGAAKTTFNKRRDQLSQFFEFCIMELRKAGSPDFHNPVKLVKKEKVAPAINVRHLEKERMIELLDTLTEDHHWLWAAIMVSGGLRLAEVLKLERQHVLGRVLTLVTPKSGAESEEAIIVETAAIRLQKYIQEKNIKDGEKIFPFLPGTVYKTIRRYGKRIGLKLSPHDLRRFIATYWDQLGEFGMRRYVLRHAGGKDLTSLEGRYVAGLPKNIIMAAQDNHMGWLK